MEKLTFYCAGCGEKIFTPSHIGQIEVICQNCEHMFSVDTGASTQESLKDAAKLPCPHCSMMLYVPANVGNKARTVCPECKEKFVFDSNRIPVAPPETDTSNMAIRFCQHCGQKMYIPVNVGEIRITCPAPSCGKTFNFDTTPQSTTVKVPAVETVEQKKPADPPRPVDPPKPVEPPKPVDPPKPVEPPKPVDPYNGKTRNLRFIYWSERIGHTLDPLMNILSKGSNLNIYDNNQIIGSMRSEGSVTLKVSPAEHRLSIGPAIGGGLYIPANDKDYLLLVNKEGMSYSLAAMPEYDPFFNGLQEFVLGMCRKRGLEDRILMSNNRNHNLHLNFRSDCMEIEWDLAHTQGIKQWATGRDGEKIYYHNINLIPPSVQPGNYMIAIRMAIASTINENTENFHCTPNGTLTLRSIGNLY